MDGTRRASSAALVLSGVLSVQLGAAMATTLFDDVGPAGTVLLRTAFSAALLAAFWRPRPSGWAPGSLRLAVLFGLVLAAMNFTFYEALDRIPLGIAVTLEFVGPFGVAVAASRRTADLAWVALAATGIVLLSPAGGGAISGAGVTFALLAGACWAAYIVIAARVGRVFSGGEGLAVAMAVGTVMLVPGGIIGGGGDLLAPAVLSVGAAVAIFSSAIPYSVELEALRHIPQGTFGVLMSLEPAVAALVGLVFLDQGLALREVVAIVLVVVASAGALSAAEAPAPIEA